MLGGPLQPQLVLLIDSLGRCQDEASYEARRALALKLHAVLGLTARECVVRLSATIGEGDLAFLLELADDHERRTPPAPTEDPRERLRRLEPARRYRDAAQVLSMLPVLASA
jgi:hypothetical protein